ncbi:MAG: glycosyl hydrolase 115 family protein, partial [Bacteroidota bacterium]|nr:glycosyl hydrolase 115 family protein [Bacteroidota bacterium]
MKLFFLSFILSCICMLTVTAQEMGSIVTASKLQGGMPVADRGSAATIVVDTLDYEVVKIAANDLRKDILNVTNVVPKVANVMVDEPQIVIGTLGRSKFIYKLVKYSHLDVSRLQNQWEKFLIQVIDSPKNPGKKILAIVGSDRRGTAYGVYELSRQIGVSPWYWWADVPVKKSKSIFVKPGCYIFGPPSVKYRGIFINDEEQGFGPWARKVYDPETKTIG